MPIEVRCFATLSQHQPQDALRYPLNEGDDVARVVQRLGVPADEVQIVFLNGRHADMDAALKDGDRLGLFPAVGGG